MYLLFQMMFSLDIAEVATAILVLIYLVAVKSLQKDIVRCVKQRDTFSRSRLFLNKLLSQ